MPLRDTLSHRLWRVALTLSLASLLAAPAIAAPPGDANDPYAGSQPGWSRGSRATDDRHAGRFNRQPLPWSQLDAQQRAFLGPLKSHWDQLPPMRQQRIAARVQRWTQLPPERQAQIRGNIARFAQMSPEQRREAARGERNFQAMAPEDRQRVMEARRRFLESLTPEQRQALREKFRAEREARQHMRQQGQDPDASGSH